MKSTKLNYENINYIVMALNNLEMFWIEKRDNSNDATEISIYNDIIKSIRNTEEKVRNKDCF